MKINKHIVKLICPSSSGSLLTDHCSGAFLNHIGRTALLAVMLWVGVLLATGCSSTGTGFSARLISPMPTNREAWKAEDNAGYEPPRSPAFSEFFGG